MYLTSIVLNVVLSLELFTMNSNRLPSASAPTREPIENFTPRAQQVLMLARKEADRFHHNYVGTEHVILGIVKLGQGVAVSVLQKQGLDLETLRAAVEKMVGTGQETKSQNSIPYTPRVKKVLAMSGKEAKTLNHSYVGTEHLLLGLLREGEGVAARALKLLDIDIERTRNMILQELDPRSHEEREETFTPPMKTTPVDPVSLREFTQSLVNILCVKTHPVLEECQGKIRRATLDLLRGRIKPDEELRNAFVSSLGEVISETNSLGTLTSAASVYEVIYQDSIRELLIMAALLENDPRKKLAHLAVAQIINNAPITGKKDFLAEWKNIVSPASSETNPPRVP
jgi:hypothetical protein